MKPKYYLAKTIIGSDKDYLPLLENIVWMPKMTDPLNCYSAARKNSYKMHKKNEHSIARPKIGLSVLSNRKYQTESKD